MSNTVATRDAGQVANVPNKSPSLLSRMAAKYSVDPTRMLNTLKATCFKGIVSDEQMVALLIVADQYQLNPFTKEIYAYPDKNNGIVPVVGVDGWIRIVNSNPNFESMTFEDGPLNADCIPQWIACAIHLRNRSQPLVIKEWFDECIRETGPWKSHPRRMLRHKAMIQCARLALGFVGIYDPDEAERISNAIDVTPAVLGKPKTEAPRARIKQLKVDSGEAPDATVKAASITAEQLAALRDKLNTESIDESLLLARFEVGDLCELPAFNYHTALEAIDAMSAGG